MDGEPDINTRTLEFDDNKGFNKSNGLEKEKEYKMDLKKRRWPLSHNILFIFCDKYEEEEDVRTCSKHDDVWRRWKHSQLVWNRRK